MLIISNDGRRLINIECIDYLSVIDNPSGDYTVSYKNAVLGRFKTENEAIELLDKISREYETGTKRYKISKE